MIVYRAKKKSKILKLMVGLIVFITAMCLTFGESVSSVL
jgi:hypothetical protein